jgi:hypothetical protein
VTQLPSPQNVARRWAPDTRTPIPKVADERATLTAFLEWHRQTFLLKCSNVDPARLSDRGVPPSRLSLHGLLRHMAGVERWWFRQQFAGEDIDLLYYSDDEPDQDFEQLSGDVAVALAVWNDECAHSRRIVEQASSLDDTGTDRSTGEPITLRFVLLTMIAEYAQHNGHADLLREQIDGATGH